MHLPPKQVPRAGVGHRHWRAPPPPLLLGLPAQNRPRKQNGGQARNHRRRSRGIWGQRMHASTQTRTHTRAVRSQGSAQTRCHFSYARLLAVLPCVPQHVTLIRVAQAMATCSIWFSNATHHPTLTPAQVPVEPEDVRKERVRVQGLLRDEGPSDSALSRTSILVDDLWKVFPPMGGNK